MSLPLRTYKDIERRKAKALELLDSLVFQLWVQLPLTPSQQKFRSAGPKLREFFGAYASEVFDIEAEEWCRLDLSSAEFQARLVEIGNSLLKSLLPPQFRLSIQYSLTALEYDSEYRSHLIGVVQSRIDYWRQRQQRPTRSAQEIVRAYCEKQTITIRQLAQECRVDGSVIYALQRGERKCSVDKVKAIAAVLGCAVEELWRPEQDEIKPA